MDVIQKSRARLLINHCFFASLLLTTEAKEDPTVETAYTTGKCIGYNPTFMRSLGVEVCEFVWAHEVMHDALLHMLRLGGRNPRKWNRACDFAINIVLKDSGFKLWEHCLINEDYRGMSAEQIYDLEEKKLEQERKKRRANGDPSDPEDDLKDDPLHGDVRPDEGNADPAQRAKTEQAVRQRVAQAANMARMAGQLDGALERFIDGILNPQVPWEDELREFMTRIVNDEESWKRRDRRFRGVYLPSKHSTKLGEVIYIGDTSGSIGDEELKTVATEVSYIATVCQPERIRMVWADTDVKHEQTFEEGEEVTPEPKGGGGTDMRVPLEHVEQYDPQIVILHTDGYTPWPSAPPPYPLIVVCTTDKEIPYGNVVRITA